MLYLYKCSLFSYKYYIILKDIEEFKLPASWERQALFLRKTKPYCSVTCLVDGERLEENKFLGLSYQLPNRWLTLIVRSLGWSSITLMFGRFWLQSLLLITLCVNNTKGFFRPALHCRSYIVWNLYTSDPAI